MRAFCLTTKDTKSTKGRSKEEEKKREKEEERLKKRKRIPVFALLLKP